MYQNSTQKEFWTFANENELRSLRDKVNVNYRKTYCDNNKSNSVDIDGNFYFISNIVVLGVIIFGKLS